MAKSEDARALRCVAEDIDDALELYRPFIAAAEGEAWRQVHELLQLIGRFAEEGSAPDAIWREVEDTLHEVHEALLAAVSRGRARGRDTPDPLQPLG